MNDRERQVFPRTPATGERDHDRHPVRPQPDRPADGIGRVGAMCVLGPGGWAAALPALSYPLQTTGMLLTGLGIGLLRSPTNTDALGRVETAARAGASGVVNRFSCPVGRARRHACIPEPASRRRHALADR